ncbi:hypothetical protein NCG89_10865 [Spongiibacter taiwanensis]|uniref:hypothetical protein n=1 Tax=Spongiibacter taiwanensis TaxID=1748242 RepID=UPI002035D928|nr:hypothetical protein [Spongiibacter taiwanensis]USA42022.1 hypothetical protein NCG89_10865 [Spongiibacter taiwanensis]
MNNNEISPRVAFYGLGFVGQQLAGFALDKGWEIAAAYNRAGDKVGRDLGELLGREAIGVIIEDCDTADYSRLNADLAFVAVSDRLNENLISYQRLMNAGANILCHGSESCNPYRLNPEVAEQIQALALANQVTFTGGGIWDMTRIWAGILSVGPNTHIESMTHLSFTDIGRQGVHLLRYCGAGLSVEEYHRNGIAGQKGLAGVARTPPLCVVDALGLELLSVEEELEPIVWEEDHHSRWLETTLKAGTVVGTRMRAKIATRQGIAVQSCFEYRDFRDDETEYMSWKVKGKPSMEVRVLREDSHMASASSLFNRAADVLAAEPGIVELWKYRPLQPSMAL